MDDGAPRLVERTAQLDALAGELARVRVDHAGRMVFVGGEAGVGKTSLLAAFVARAGAPVWRGSSEPLQSPRALGPVLDLAAQMGGRFADLAASGSGSVELVAALAEELVGGEVGVLVLEDLHWADEATLDFVRVLGRRLDRVHALVLASYRDVEVGRAHPVRTLLGELATERSVSRLAVPPLTVRGVAELVGADGDAASLHALTQGNSFFVTEVLAGGDDTVPDTVRDAVLARRARMSVDEQTLLDAVAVLPGRAELWLLEQVAGTTYGAIEGCLASGMLVEDGDGVRFRHEIARVAVEDSLSGATRAALHARVLAALVDREPGVDPARIAHHADSAGDRASVLRHAPLAGERAAALGAHREAAGQFALALRNADAAPDDVQAHLLERHSYECYLTDRMDEAFASRHGALAIHERAGDRLREGDAHRWLSRLAWFRGDHATAASEADAAVRILGDLSPGPELAMAYSNLSQLRMLSHDLDAALVWSDRAIALAEELGEIAIIAHAENNAGAALLTGGRLEGVARIERSLDLAIAHDLEEHVARAWTNLGAAFATLHQLGRADEALEAGIDYCGDHDLDSWRLYMAGWRALVRLCRGDLDGAEADAAAVLTNPRAALPSRIMPATVLGRLQARRGDRDVWSFLDNARAHALRADELQRLAPVAVARAEALLLENRAPEVAAETDGVLRACLDVGDEWLTGELLVLRRRAGIVERTPADAVAEPYRLELAEKFGEAAEVWDALGQPYERAWALVSSDPDSARDGVAALHALGVSRAADVAAAQLRERGIASVPRGPRASTATHPFGLTAREAEVLALLATGLTNVEIAERAALSRRTVDHHVSAVLRKLEVGNRRQAARLAVTHGLVSAGEGQAADRLHR